MAELFSKITGSPSFVPPYLDIFSLAEDQGETLASSRTTRVSKICLAPNTHSVLKLYKYPTKYDKWRGLLRGTFLGTPAARREASNLHRLSAHKLSPKVFDYREERRYGFLCRAVIVMEFLEGFLPMQTYLELGDEALTRSIMDAVLDRVNAMHALGFEHRDLFPRNILVNPSGESALVRFVDFRKGRWGSAPLSTTGRNRDLSLLRTETDS
ncbi:MAG: lipopolysaccharide kinase InaA family protein [Planctomycetes bacterium]|nr:lipopolysaccharide kinase InaA family protein [Planctomycetota bacterium]